MAMVEHGTNSTTRTGVLTNSSFCDEGEETYEIGK